MHNRLQATRMVAQLAGGPPPNAAPDKGAKTPCPKKGNYIFKLPILDKWDDWDV